MSRNKIVFTLLVTLIACMLMLTACGGPDVTTDAGAPTATPTATPTPVPTPTPDPLLSMDESERAVLLFNKANEAMDTVTSFTCLYEMDFSIISSGTVTSSKAIAKMQQCNIGDEDFSSSMVIETIDAENNSTVAGSGYFNGYAYDYSDSRKWRASMTASEYDESVTDDDSVADDVFNPDLTTCTTIKSSLQDDGSWELTFKDYTVDVSRRVFEELFPDIAKTYGSAISNVSIEVQVVIDKDYNVNVMNMYIGITSYQEYGFSMSFDVCTQFSDYNQLEAIEQPDISDFVLVEDIDIVSKIQDSVYDKVEIQDGRYTYEGLWKVSGAVAYDFRETYKGTYGYKGDVYFFDVTFDYYEGFDDGTVFEDKGRYTFDGSKYTYGSDHEESVEMFMTEEQAKETMVYELTFVSVSESEIYSYTVTQLASGKKVEIVLAEETSQEILGVMYNLSGVTWTIKDYSGTVTVTFDAEENVTSIVEKSVATVVFGTYEATVKITDSIDFTK